MKHLVAVLLLLVSAQIAMAGKVVEQKFEHFTLSLPEGMVVKKVSPVEDFDLYSFEKNGQSYVTIYLGNQPSFPLHSAARQEVVKKSAAGDVQMIAFWRDHQLTHMESLRKLAAKGWPTYLHAWISEGLHPVELSTAQVMLMSIDTGGKHRLRTAP